MKAYENNFAVHHQTVVHKSLYLLTVLSIITLQNVASTVTSVWFLVLNEIYFSWCYFACFE